MLPEADTSAERAALERALDHALRWLDGRDERPVGPTVGAPELRRRLRRALPEGPTDAVTIVDELARDVDGGLMGNNAGRFFAWVMGGAVPAAIAADWLASAWDQNAGITATAPAVAVIEEVAGAWMLDLLELPGEASFGFTTGCQMAHLTALAAARRRLLLDRGWDPERRGLRGSPPLRVLSGEHGHETVDRAAQFLGIGTENVHRVATAGGRMNPDSLAEALGAAGDDAVVVCLSAGDIHGGRFDDFRTLIPLCRRRPSTWVHVDGAFGLWVRVSDRHRGHLDGVEEADSWIVDGHKWLNTTFDAGFVAVRDRDAHRGAMTAEAPYISDGGARDPVDWNPEWSRRARAVPVYAAIRALGRSGIAGVVDRCCDAVARIVSGLGEMPGAEVVMPVTTNQGLVRFLDPSGEDDDAFTERVVAALQADGTAFFTGMSWHGVSVMRVSAVGWNTTPDDVEATLAAAASVLSRLGREAAAPSA